MVLQVDNLHKSYRTGFLAKKTKVLHGVSFTIPEGSVVGFIGANGAGKTTTIKAILGLTKADSGDFTYFNGQNISPKLFQKIGFLPERPHFYGFLTAKEFLNYYGKLSQKFSAAELRLQINKTLKKVNLFDSRNKPIKTFSKGMIQRIGIAQALLHDPQFIILDEPLSGLDPDGRYQVSQIISQASKQGKTIFFSSHLLDDTQRLCDRVVIVKKGQVSYQGTINELLSKVKSSYLISYLKNNKSCEENVSNDKELNQAISKIMAEGGVIGGILKTNGSLEEAYVHLTLDQSL